MKPQAEVLVKTGNATSKIGLPQEPKKKIQEKSLEEQVFEMPLQNIEK